MRRLVGHYPEEFFFQIENSRPRTSPLCFDLTVQHRDQQIAQNIDRDTADDLLEKYFTLVHPFHSFIDRQELVILYENAMDHGLGSDNQSALVLAVLALGATASDPIDSQKTQYSGDGLTQEAVRIVYKSWDSSFGGDIILSQAIILCALYFTYKVEPLAAWRLVHMASTTIQQIMIRCKDRFSTEAEAQEIHRLCWVCFILESDILAEFHQPRSGIEIVVDQIPFPNYGQSPLPDHLYSLAEISARSLLNRIHHTVYFKESSTVYGGQNSPGASIPTQASAPRLDPSLSRVCEELGHQLEAWYGSLPEVIRPRLGDEFEGSRHSIMLRLRYESAPMSQRPY
ncbi:hypothetical protein FBEOM_14444 [Fusarium beomiforme]|uniref:Xylanolytic transcriptional activator regulatory domain-containing protein n=1 Tax=Fusarium beomiforme TaxID=44412 RepID=A0A9P5DR45_9HYPO|nr:hypothetical protein FBEOM_14444 [Fusarium beomiforme]